MRIEFRKCRNGRYEFNIVGSKAVLIGAAITVMLAALGLRVERIVDLLAIIR
jgi:hypothetical protein